MEEVHFDFVVAKNNEEEISEEEMNNLMDAFIDVVEKLDMSLGGGCKEYVPEDDDVELVIGSEDPEAIEGTEDAE